MRQIYKKDGDIDRFNAWAKAEKLHTWPQFSDPKSKFHSVYEMVREYISENEQMTLSAYTEKPLSRHIHIDHFRKRSIYPTLIFDYSNFVVDDIDDNYGACFKDNRAGVSESTFDGPGRIFCPIDENMAQFVDFTYDGTMVAKRGLLENIDDRVAETIRVFNLNHQTLRKKRADIIRIIREYKTYGLPDEEIRNCMEKTGFPTVVNWALRIV